MLIRLRTPPAPRRGVVLIAVLLIIVVLSLAAYQYGEWISAENRAAVGYTRSVQTRALANSGVNYTVAMISNSDTMTNTLNGNPFDNAQAFQNVVVLDDGSSRRGMFTILSLLSPDDPNFATQPYRYGLSDEAGKININALLQLDNGKGDAGYTALMLLPNMTDDVANAIIDWISPGDTPRSNGAKDDYYSSLTPPYHCKNGPLDSLEELLLVRGVTAQLLFGNDHNRNGVLDADEIDDGSGAVDLGWSAYLTVYSREPNSDAQGNARININDPDVNGMGEKLTAVLGQDMANYIIAYRLYGPAPSAPTPGATGAAKGGAASGAMGAAKGGAAAPSMTAPTQTMTAPAQTASFTPLSGSDNTAVQGQIRTDRASSKSKPQTISSLYDLVGSKVSVSTGSGRTAKAIILPSPLNDPGQLKTLLPLLLDETTTTLNSDLAPRINVNTASQTVLSTLPGLQDGDIQNILSMRPDPTSATTAPDPIFQTPAWLLTQANIPIATVKAIAPYITARTQVYRFQALGYYEGGGPMARVEAVIDGNNGRPRIVYRRDLAELGSGFDVNALK
jgi:type II secretory pathway component PulK